MKNYLLLWGSLVGYVLVSYVLLLRDEWAIKSIALFYPSLGETLISLRELAISFYLNTVPTFIYAAVVLSAFWFYWRLIRGRWIKGQTTRTLIIASLLLQVTLLFSYPALSTDVFDYILNSRVAFLYQQNPWLIPSIAFPLDPFINLGSWQRIPSVYGPTHHLLSILPALVGGNDLIRWLVGFKLLMLVCVVISILIVAKLVTGKDKAKLLALFALNPFLLIESLGNAHNDIIMVAFMLASYLAFRRRQWILAGVSLGLGMMLKLFAVVFLPMYLWLLIREKRKLMSSISLLGGFFVSVVAGVWVMGVGTALEYLRLLDWVFTLRLNSLPNLLNQFPNWVFTAPFAVLALWVLLRVKDERKLIKAYVGLTLLYLMFVVPLYWAWYPIWYLPFLSLFPINKLTKAALTFSATSQPHYSILFISHRFNYQHIFWTIAIYLLLVIPPILTYSFARNGYQT